jgi:hypothetical protein
MIYHFQAVRWKGWFSPDGIQVLANIHLSRQVHFGEGPFSVMDIARPLHIDDAFVDSSKGLANGPVVYCHGGGHFCVKGALLLHSMTPLARAGLTVYSLEYPLSPEDRFPSAVLSVIRACVYIKKTHCRNPECHFACASRSSPSHHADNSHECNAHEPGGACASVCACTVVHCDAGVCVHCGGPLGTDSIQLVGDSAGGNLVSMAAMLLCKYTFPLVPAPPPPPFLLLLSSVNPPTSAFLNLASYLSIVQRCCARLSSKVEKSTKTFFRCHRRASHGYLVWRYCTVCLVAILPFEILCHIVTMAVEKSLHRSPGLPNFVCTLDFNSFLICMTIRIAPTCLLP